MLILVDGADHTGKTELIERITAHLHTIRPDDTVEVRRNPPPTLHPLDEYVTPLLTYRPGSRHHIICDRWHWNEDVTARMTARETLLDTALTTYVDMFLQSRGALGVQVHRDPYEIQDAARSRGTPLVSELDISRTQRLYAYAKNRALFNAVTVRPDEHGVEDYVTAEAARAELRAQSLAGLTTYIGPANVHTLLLGNTRGPGMRHPDGPAFMPYPSTCGAYLMRALTGVTHTSRRPHNTPYGIANANDVDSLHHIVQAVTPMRIVALGPAAYRTCFDYFGAPSPDNNLDAVPHPVLMLRRHGKSSSPQYGDWITDPGNTTRQEPQ